MIRDFLAAGLIDHLRAVVVPILLSRGVRLWDGLEPRRVEAGLHDHHRKYGTMIADGLESGRNRTYIRS